MNKHKLNQAGFHLIYPLIVIFVIILIGVVGWRVYDMQQKQAKPQTSSGQVDRTDPFIQQYGNNCEDKPRVSFTNSPITTDQLGFIHPMGKVDDGHVTPTDHVYLTPLNPDAADNSYNVVMPADGRVVQIDAMPAQYIGDRQGVQTAPSDHRVVIAHSCQYYSIFIHVHKLSDKLAQEAGQIEPGKAKQVLISLNAGEPIGQIGGNPVDWTLVDLQTKLSGFISPALYQTEPWKIHSIDPLSVYSEPLQSQLAAKSLRSRKPVGGKIDYDKAGSLVGNWFRAGTNGYKGASQDRYWDGHLSVAPSYIDPDHTVVSLGNWQGKATQFAVKGNVDPTQITKTNSPVKYELLQLSYMTPEGANWSGRNFASGLSVNQRGNVIGTIMFEVQDGEKLKVEKFPGKTADQVNVFTGAAEIYER